MSEENVEAYRRAVAAFNRGDVDAMLEELGPEIEWHSQVAGLGREVYRGHDGVRDLFRDIREVFARIAFDVSDLRDLGDRALATGRLHARGHESGVQTEVPFNQLVDFERRRVTRLQSFLDSEEALAAAGLSE
jgi:ketosteroid isomerase-like protein